LVVGYHRGLLLEGPRTLATFHPLPVRGDVAPMTAARIALATHIRALADEIEELERVQRPAERLGRIGAELRDLETQVAATQAVEDQRYGEWLGAGQIEERPRESLPLIHARERLEILRRDVRGAEAVRPAAEALYAAQAAKVSEAQQARDEALCVASVDAAAEFSRSIWTPALTEALCLQAVLQGLVDELRELNGRSPGAAAAAHTIIELIASTRRSITVAQDRTPRRTLITRLYTDARAALEPT
jgi:hypothetical protein